jgi:hypothetical protein
LPKPCTATVAPRWSTPASRRALKAAYMTPRLVAPPRPSEPPTDTGLPVTTPVTCSPCAREGVHHPGHRLLVRADVGAGMSFSGPMIGMISLA